MKHTGNYVTPTENTLEGEKHSAQSKAWAQSEEWLEFAGVEGLLNRELKKAWRSLWEIRGGWVYKELDFLNEKIIFDTQIDRGNVTGSAVTNVVLRSIICHWIINFLGLP